MRKYIGNPLQIYGVEEVRLCGGKGDGMRILNVRNGAGLDFSISLDRCGDISRMTFKGDNIGYFSPCGYVAPAYYDQKGAGFLKSFTAGFLTTCGLTAVGTPCVDDGEETPLHGTIANTPCDNFAHWIANDEIHIKIVVRDAVMFSHQLELEREYICPLGKNVVYMTDKIRNIGSKECPLQLLYHCNFGYPLLTEKSEVIIPSTDVAPRTEHAKEGIENCRVMEKPQNGYEEKCYYHSLSGETCVSISNPDIGKKASIKYNADNLKYFTEWKMMGEYEYVLGLEPGNTLPDGRDAMRKNGAMDTIAPDEEKVYSLTFEFAEEK